MAISPINLKPKEKSGGGLFGKLAGTVVGGIAGAVTGNPQLALSGAAMGGSLGGIIGDEVSKPGIQQRTGSTSLENASKVNPEVAIAQLNEAQKLLETDLMVPDNELQNYRSHFDMARQKLKERMGA